MAVTFIVEDGTGLETATSYLSVEDLKQYFEDFGYSYGTATDDNIKTYLNKSSKVLDSMFLEDFLKNGYRVESDQGLEWPRYSAVYVDGNIIDSDIVPPEIENATAELVYSIISGDTLQNTVSADGIIKQEAVKVDDIETSNEYFEGSSSVRDDITAVYDAMARIIGGSGSQYELDIIRV